MKPTQLFLAAASASLALAGGYGAVAATPKQTIEARQANFKILGKSFKAMRDEIGKSSPDLAVLKANANAMAGAAPKVAGFFPKGTGPESKVKTAALPEIWVRPADFTKIARDLVPATKALQAATTVDQFKAAMGGVGKTCKSCHDQFKAKDD